MLFLGVCLYMLKNEITKELQMEEISYLDSLLTTGFDEPYDHSIDTIDPDEPTDLPGEYNGIPEMEGTMESLEDLVNGIVGDPEFLGGR